MNYAQDRLDRKIRGTELQQEYIEALETQNDAQLGQALRDSGNMRQAVFHFARAYYYFNDDGGCDDHHESKTSNTDDGINNSSSSCPADPNMITKEERLGDYAQMAELAGFPEIGILAIYHYQLGINNRDRQQQDHKPSFVTNTTTQNAGKDAWQLLMANYHDSTKQDYNCGCGLEECGKSLCYLIPTMDDLEETVLKPLEMYVQNLSSTNNSASTIPTAHQVLTAQAKQNHIDNAGPFVPLELQFWVADANNKPQLSPVLQLLLLKQLYLVLPTLAAQALIHISLSKEECNVLTTRFKSHNAYYILIQAMIFGPRIKPHRRKTLTYYHVPTWDIFFGHDGRHFQNTTTTTSVEPDELILNHFRQVISCCRAVAGGNDSFPPAITSLSMLSPPFLPANYIYVVGDSHVLSFAYQTISIHNKLHLLYPVVVTGLKAWHCRPESQFFTHYLLKLMLQRIPTKNDNTTILVSAGEIDCREGMGGPELEGYKKPIPKHCVEGTVREFVQALSVVIPTHFSNIYVLPVAPHAQRRSGKVTGRNVRRQVTQIWNEQLRRELHPAKGNRIQLLDYESHLTTEEGYLKPCFNADGTHMNSAFLTHLDEAMNGS